MIPETAGSSLYAGHALVSALRYRFPPSRHALVQPRQALHDPHLDLVGGLAGPRVPDVYDVPAAYQPDRPHKDRHVGAEPLQMNPPVLLEVVGEHELLDDVLYLRDRAVPVTDAVNLGHHHLRPYKQVVQLHRVDDYLRLLLLARQQGRLVVFRSWHNTMLFFCFLRAAAGTPPPKTKPKPRRRRR